MHREVVRDEPGACPICGMALEPRTVTLEEPPNPELIEMSRRLWWSVAPAQRRVAELVLLGRSTRQMVAELKIGEHTVQDHLKVVFDKLGVGSRRELVAALLR